MRLQGGVSSDRSVLSGVPQGTVLGLLLFIILMGDIRYEIISSVDDCTILQNGTCLLIAAFVLFCSNDHI